MHAPVNFLISFKIARVRVHETLKKLALGTYNLT